MKKKTRTIVVHNLSGLPTCKYSDFLELQEDFKIDDPEKNKKLQNRIKEVGFKYPVFAWRDEVGQLWTIDAHQRKKALEELYKEGYTIPKIPYVLIQAESKDVARKEILLMNSRYAEIDPESEFLKVNYDETIDTDVEAWWSNPEIVEHSTDFSEKNKEIDVDEFSAKLTLKFELEELEYVHITEYLQNLDDNKEQALLKLTEYES